MQGLGISSSKLPMTMFIPYEPHKNRKESIMCPYQDKITSPDQIVENSQQSINEPYCYI